MYHNDEYDRIVTFLRQGEWFSALDTSLQEDIMRLARVKRFTAGQTIYLQDQNPLGLFVVLEGQASLSRTVDTGDEFLYFVSGPGFWFGEFAALRDSPTVVSATARTAIRALYLPTARLRQLTAGDSENYQAFAELALQKYDVAMRSIANMAHLSPEEHLRARLIDMCKLATQTGINTSTHELSLTQSEIASMIGVSRQTANQLLKKLERDNVVEVSFRNVRVLESATMSAAH